MDRLDHGTRMWNCVQVLVSLDALRSLNNQESECFRDVGASSLIHRLGTSILGAAAAQSKEGRNKGPPCKMIIYEDEAGIPKDLTYVVNA
jgi:hypothetical protein